MQLEKWYLPLRDTASFNSVLKRWKELSSTIGKRIRITDIDGKIIGKAIDIDEHGGLVIRTDVGNKVKKMTGDVVEIG